MLNIKIYRLYYEMTNRGQRGGASPVLMAMSQVNGEGWPYKIETRETIAKNWSNVMTSARLNSLVHIRSPGSRQTGEFIRSAPALATEDVGIDINHRTTHWYRLQTFVFVSQFLSFQFKPLRTMQINWNYKPGLKRLILRIILMIIKLRSMVVT